MNTTNNSSFWGGIILLALGALFLLDNMHVLDFGEFFSNFWPLILIIIGINLIMKVRRENRNDTPAGDPPAPSAKPLPVDKIAESNLFGDLKLKLSSDKFRGGSINNVFGDIEVDMSGCTMEPGSYRLNVNGVFGDVMIYLPANAAVKVDCSAVAGDIAIEGNKREGLFPRMAYQDQNYPGSTVKLDLYGSIIFGSVRINRK
jgi:predicted membrane protein